MARPLGGIYAGEVWKVPLFVFLVPLLAGFVLRRVLYHRVMLAVSEMKFPELSLEARAFAERVLQGQGKVEVSAWRHGGVEKSGAKMRVRLPRSWARARTLAEAGQAAQLAGLALYKQEQKQAVNWREQAVHFGIVGPLFTLVVVIFAMIVGKLPPLYGVSAVISSVGLATVFLMLTQVADLMGAQKAVRFLNKNNPLASPAEREALIRVTKAAAWRRLIPGCLGNI